MKAQKKGPVHWFDREPGPANDTEVLTLALVVCDSGESAAGTDAWASEVCLETARKEQLGDKWKPPATAPWVSDLRKPGRNYLIVKNALEQPRTDDKLARIAKAVHVLDDLKGHTDVLDAGRLKDYFSQERREAKAPGSKKKDGELRWKGALIEIAKLVAKHRVRFQRALADDRERSSLQPTLELLAEERAAVQDLSKELEKVKVARQTAEKRHASLKAANNKYKQSRKAGLKTAITKAKKTFAEKKKAVKAADAKVLKQRVKEALERMGRTAEDMSEKRVRAEVKKTAVARKRARDVEKEADESGVRLKKMKQLKEDLAEARETVDTYREVLAAALAAKKRYLDKLDKLQSIRSWELERPKGAGRGAKTLAPYHRLCMWDMHSMGIPSSSIGKAIVRIAKTTCPWLEPIEPTPAMIGYTRFEMGIADECMSARRVADAVRVRQLGMDATTKFHVPSMVTSVLIEPKDNPSKPEVVILRAAYGTGGATAACEATAVEDKCFARLRRRLIGWRDKCKQMFPNYVWTGPDAKRCGLHRLGGGGAITTDTCTTARCTTDLLIKMVAKLVEEATGAVAWAAMSEDERVAAVRCHATHCWQHIRNIFLAPMSSAMSELLKVKLGEDLDAFSAQERIGTSMSELLRSDYKEFHRGCRYYKGAGMDFWDYVLQNFPTAFLVPFERADAGRQDLDFNAAVAMYINRKYIVSFLAPRVLAKGHSNLLEESIWVTHTKFEYIAMIRAAAIIDLRIAVPLRWIAGNGSKLSDWSPFSMSPVLSKIEDLFERGSRDGSVLLAASLDIFEPIASSQPEFEKYFEWLETGWTVRAADRKTVHYVYKQALAELLDPQDKDNVNTRDLTIEFLQAACADGLSKLHDQRTILPQYLSSQDGRLTLEKQGQAHADTIGCELSNDKFAESVFGTFDRMLTRCPGISREAAAALTHAMRHKAYAFAEDSVKRRKTESERKTPLPPPTAGMGYVFTLPQEEELSLIEYSRLTVRDSRNEDAAATAEHTAYVRAKVRTSAQEQLDLLITEYGYGLSFFKRWKERGVKSVTELSKALKEVAAKHPGDARKAYQEQLDWLREQVEMRVRGLRWTHFKTQWGSVNDEDVGTVEQLTGHIKEILAEERDCRAAGELPEAAVPPTMARKSFKALGTRTKQAEGFGEDELELGAEELLRRAEAEHVRLAAAGEIDDLHDQMPAKAPAWDKLSGVLWEICWRYWVPYTDTNGRQRKRQQFIWSEGEVVEVATAVESRLPAKIRKELGEHPQFRAVRIRWPADKDFGEKETFSWSVFCPDDWCETKHLGWRYAPCELAKLGAIARAK